MERARTRHAVCPGSSGFDRQGPLLGDRPSTLGLQGLANGGRLVAPYLVEPAPPPTPGVVTVDPEDLAIVNEGLRLVIRGRKGTLITGRLPVAGETGTAQVARLQEDAEPDELPNASAITPCLSARAPLDEPRLVVAVIVNTVGVREGGGPDRKQYSRLLWRNADRTNEILITNNRSEDHSTALWVTALQMVVVIFDTDCLSRNSNRLESTYGTPRRCLAHARHLRHPWSISGNAACGVTVVGSQLLVRQLAFWRCRPVARLGAFPRPHEPFRSNRSDRLHRGGGGFDRGADRGPGARRQPCVVRHRDIHPSADEFARLATILMVAAWLGRRRAAFLRASEAITLVLMCAGRVSGGSRA